MPQTFKTSRRVEFRDTDAAGIVHFSVFFNWMEEAEHELLRHLGLSVFSEHEDGPITWPRVAARCDYQNPIRFEQVVQIEIQIVRLGEKSVTYEFAFSCEQGPLAVGEMTSVCCRLMPGGTLRAIAIPDAISEKLAPLVVA